MNCEKCKNEIPTLNLSEESKLMLWGLIFQDLKIFATKHLMDKENFSHREAKLIVRHFNPKKGVCHNCKKLELDGAYTQCPKCKSFNYNIDCESSFNGDFCTHLMFNLDFDQLEDERLRGFWCDGVDQIPTSILALSKNVLLNSKKLETRAYLGKSGQEIYGMTIEFGDRALEKYLNNESIVDCIPEGNYKEWISVDPVSKKAIVKLK